MPPNQPKVRCFLNHSAENQFKPCEVDDKGSLTRIYCNKHGGAQFSCNLHTDDERHNAQCSKCCFESNVEVHGPIIPSHSTASKSGFISLFLCSSNN